MPTSTQAVCGPVDGGPGVDTDKEDYQPEETVIVTGCALEAYEGQNLTLSITRPDGVVDAYTVTVSSGGFTYNYLLDGILGTYTVKVMDGATLLASETFTDHTSTTLQINSNDAATHSLSVTLTVGWSGSGGDPTQARFVNVTPTALGCPSPLDPGWSPWVATSPPSPDTFAWSLAAGSQGHRKVCAQTGHGPVGSPTPGLTLTADDTIWYTVANPALPESCGLDMVLVIDSSGSINATELAQMKSAFNSFVASFLPETPTEMAVVDFDTSAAVIQPFTSSESTLNTAINSVVSGGNTNWDDALFDARGLFPHRPTKPDLMVFASDGNPNVRGGHVFPGHSPVALSVTEQDAMDHATDESDQAKTDNIRMLGLGIGSDLDVLNMKAVTGNISHPPAPISFSVDVITSDFSTLAADLSELAAELCGGTIIAHKIIDGDGDLGTTGDQTPGAGWTFTTNVDPPDSSNPASSVTDATGTIDPVFDIQTGADDTANVDVTETLLAGYGFLSSNCAKPGAVGTPAFGAVNNITVNKFDIVNCYFYNVPLGMIEWEKRDESSPANPLQGGASFTGGGATGPLACTGTPTNPLPVVDNGVNDADPDPGQLKLNNVCPGTYVVTETVAPTGYAKDDDLTRSVTVASPTLNQVIGTQGSNDPGNTDESDFHNRLGSLEWEKRQESGSPPHPLQGGATFTVGGSSGPFACTGTATNPITVVDNGANDADLDPGQIQVINVCLGSYTVTETGAPAGFTIDDDPTRAVTVSEADLNNVIGTQATDEDGNTDESDFHNVGVGTITITKDAQPNDAQDFSFSGTCFAAFNLDDDGANSNPLSSSMTATHVAPSTCTVVEDGPPAGWVLSALVCIDPDSGTTVSVGTRTATIDLDPGETVTCTFTDRTTAQFIVNKDFQPNNGGTVTISLVCTSGTVANDDTSASEADPANFTVTGFTPGTTCTATETPPGGYIAIQTNCQNVPITAGGTATCTIVNQLAGTITIIKDAVPNDPQDFDFACSLLGVFSLDDDADGTLSNTKTFADVTPGNYTCTETNEPGWATVISCSDPDNGSTGSGGTATIDLDAGETVTCTFTNTFTPGQLQPVGGTAGLLDQSAFGRASDSTQRNTLAATLVVVLLAAVVTPAAGLCLAYIRRSR